MADRTPPVASGTRRTCAVSTYQVPWKVSNSRASRGSAPVVTPQEYRIATGAEPLEALEFDTFHGTW